jgi:cyclophilin family peptidyl-prolyl cis-trans isomerase
MLNNTKIIYSVAVIIIIALFGGAVLLFSATDNKSTSPVQSTSPSPLAQVEGDSAGTPNPMEIDQQKQYKATLHTTAGDITVELNAKATPITVNNFVALARKGFYNNTIFHRVLKDFMIQGGDPQGTGAGGPGYQFDDEPFEGEYTRGTLAMANAGPNTNGSQFFIMHKDTPLQKNYVIFGKVIQGIEVVDKIAEAEVSTGRTGEPSTPVNPVKVTSVDIVEQ